MNKLQRGLAESVAGIVMGFLLITIVTSFAQDGLIPGYFVWLFGLFFIIANIATLNHLRLAGLLYAIGWLTGATLVIDLLGPIDIAFNIVGPSVTIILRIWFWVKSEL